MLTLLVTGGMVFAAGEQEEAEPAEDEEVTLSMYARYRDEETQVPLDYTEKALQEEYPNVEIDRVQQGPDPGAGASNNDGRRQRVRLPVRRKRVFPYVHKRIAVRRMGTSIPETLDDLEEAVEIFRDNDIVPLSLFGGKIWNTVSAYDAFATRFDPRGILGLDQGETDITDDASLRAAETMRDLIQDGLLPRGVTALEYDEARSLFYEEEAAMFTNGHWEIADSTESLGDDVDWIPFPVHPDFEDNRMAFAGGSSIGGFAVSGGTDHPDLADAVAALFAEKYAETRVRFRGNPIDALEDATQELLTGDLAAEDFIDQLEGQF